MLCSAEPATINSASAAATSREGHRQLRSDRYSSTHDGTFSILTRSGLDIPKNHHSKYGSIFDCEFRKDFVQVNFHCSFSEIEMSRDFFVTQPFSDESGYF